MLKKVDLRFQLRMSATSYNDKKLRWFLIIHTWHGSSLGRTCCRKVLDDDITHGKSRQESCLHSSMPLTGLKIQQYGVDQYIKGIAYCMRSKEKSTCHGPRENYDIKVSIRFS